MTKDLGPIHRQAAFDLPGTQRDLFDTEDDAADATFELIRAEETKSGDSDALFDKSQGGNAFDHTWTHGNASDRLIYADECARLIQLDHEMTLPPDQEFEIEIDARIAISAVGHFLVLAATMERALRRFGAAFAEAAKRIDLDMDMDHGSATREVLKSEQTPAPIDAGGLRLRSLTLRHDAVWLEMRTAPGLPLGIDRCPHFAAAYAIGSVTERAATVYSSQLGNGSLSLALPALRYKAISDGPKHGTIDLFVRRSTAGETDRVQASL